MTTNTTPATMSHKPHINCSVGILTFNSEKTLGRALESVKECKDIIICDGGSTDGTRAIATQYGARILDQDKRFKYENNKIRDFSGVRNQMLHTAKYSWFLFVDSDEYMTPETMGEIGRIISNESSVSGAAPASMPAAYWVPRKYSMNGVVIDCASTYPNVQMRFFHKDAVTQFIKPIHERIEVRPGAPVKRLMHHMIVPIESSIADIQKKWNYYIDIEVARRPRISLWKWLSIAFENGKASALYSFRFARNLLFCSGTKLPWRHEWERHVYNIKLSARLLKNIRL